MRYSRKITSQSKFWRLQQELRAEVLKIEEKIKNYAEWMERFRVTGNWDYYDSYRELWSHFVVRRRSLLRQLITLQVRNFKGED